MTRSNNYNNYNKYSLFSKKQHQMRALASWTFQLITTGIRQR